MSRLHYGSPRNPGPSPTAARPSGVWVGVVVVVLSCICAVVYAQQAAVEVAYRLLVEGGLAIAWMAAAAGWGAWPTRWLLGSRRGGSRHYSSTLAIATAAAVGLGIMSLLVLGVGLAGQLSLGIGIFFILLGLLLGVGCLLRTPGKATEPGPKLPGDARWQWLWLAVVPALSLALVAAYVAPGLLWKPQEPHGYDVVEYHFQIPREWYETGRIQPLEHNTFSYFPFGVEMHYLLAMHLRGGAWQGMYLAQLMHVMMAALSVIAASGFANHLARRRSSAVIAALMGATAPWLSQLAPIGFNEGGLLLYGTLAIGWVAIVLAPSPDTAGLGDDSGMKDEGRRRKQDDSSLTVDPSSSAARPLPAHRERGQSFRLFALAGLCAGFACGAKLTAVPLLLLAVPAVAFGLLVRRSPRFAFSLAAVFVAVGLIAFSPWLIRNIVWTGNPVFPEGRALLGNGPFSDVQAERWQKAHAPQPAQQSIGGRLSALLNEVILNWQFGRILLPLAIAAMAIYWRSNVSRLLAGLLAIQTLFWLGFTHLQGRFFVLAIPIGVLAIATAPWDTLAGDPRRRRPLVAPLLAIAVVAVGLINWWQVHRRLAFKLYEEQDTGMSVALGQADISWITHDAIQGFPLDDPSARLLLVGDAQAFWYPLPPSRLSYRTIFDLDTAGGRSLIDAFDPQGLRHDGKTWLLVTPTELDRYERTYQPLPPIPDAWKQSPAWEAGVPFLVPPAEVKRWAQGG